MKILHTGDLHIGSFPGPTDENGRNLRLAGIEECLHRLVEIAEEEKPDIAVVAGDVFHAARVWSDRGLAENRIAIDFIEDLSRICPVTVMRGTPNHDSEQQMESLKRYFAEDRSVEIVTEPQMSTCTTRYGETVNIACVPGFDRGFYRAKHPGLSKEEETEVFTRAIADTIIGLKAMAPEGNANILVSHFTIAGANMESGQTAFFGQYEPIVYPDTLETAGYDLNLFGHIHRPQVVEGCRNTFYCGAVSALNFNDEGQKRGFYIHDIQEDGKVESRFFELPTREFLTINLTDADVAQLNENGPDSFGFDRDDIEGKIVRVLYDCTDEHNKAFNHATLENWLYSTGKAFWVQEITPKKISITVDKRSMDADDGPEESLKKYLEEKGLDEKQAGPVMDLARPIIQQAMELSTTEKRSGVFVPVEIEVRNYRNYRQETFSFDGISFATVNGENGAGKSSLVMDAIQDALFEEPREGDLTGWICNDPDARSGSIIFTFRIGEATFRVTRTRTKSGKATLNIAELVDGEWEDRSREKFKDTQAEILNILGMDSMTLKAVALIMQDQYGLFLQADKEARMSILGSILGLAVYDTMGDIAADKLTDVSREIRTLMDKADAVTRGLPDLEELGEEIERGKKDIEERKQIIEEEEKKCSAIEGKMSVQEEAAERALKLSQRIAGAEERKAAKEAALTAQRAIAATAERKLASEPEIKDGMERRAQLLAEEKDAIAKMATLESLKNERALLLKMEKEQAAELEVAREAQRTAEQTEEALKQRLAKAGELEEKHREFEEACRKSDEADAKEERYTKADAELKRAEAALETEKQKQKTKFFRAESELEAAQKKVQLLAESLCPNVETATCLFLKDAKRAEEQIPDLAAEVARLRTGMTEEVARASEECIRLQEERDSIGYDREAQKKYIGLIVSLRDAEAEYQKLEEMRGALATATADIEAARAKVETLEGKHADTVVKGASAEARIEAAKGIEKEYDNIMAGLTATEIWVRLEKELPQHRESLKNAQARIEELAAEIGQIEADLAESREQLVKEKEASAGVEELRKQAEEQKVYVDSLKKILQNLTVSLGAMQGKYEDTEKKHAEAAEYQKEASRLGVTAAGLDLLKKAFSQDGIPHNITRSVIPVFEATATNILGQMSGGRMSVEFQMERTLKSNNKKEVATLDIIINDADTGRLPYLSRSGGERVKAALAVILALSEIKSNQAGVQLGFISIDEPPFLDSTGTQAYVDALETIRERYPDKKIIAISHDQEFKARFPQSISVFKDEEGSHAVMD